MDIPIDITQINPWIHAPFEPALIPTTFEDHPTIHTMKDTEFSRAMKSHMITMLFEHISTYY